MLCATILLKKLILTYENTPVIPNDYKSLYVV